MKSTVNVETTVISYLAAARSKDLVVAAHQQITREWWDRRDRFELVVSQAVIDEVSRGDDRVAKRRLALLSGVPALTLSDDAVALAAELVGRGAVPVKAQSDALHISVAAVNRIACLMTWNCRHIANAAVRGKIEAVCAAAGALTPTTCTPEELMEV